MPARMTCFVLSVVLTACTAVAASPQERLFAVDAGRYLHHPRVRGASTQFRTDKMPPATRAEHGRRAVQRTQEDAAAAFAKQFGLKARWAAERISERFTPMKSFQTQGPSRIRDAFESKSSFAQRKRRQHDKQASQAPSFEDLDTDGDLCISTGEIDGQGVSEEAFAEMTRLSEDSDCGVNCDVKDSDCEISLADYQVASGVRPPAFEKLDTNDDNCLSEAEFAQSGDYSTLCPFQVFTGMQFEDGDCGEKNISRADFEAAFSGPEQLGWPPICLGAEEDLLFAGSSNPLDDADTNDDKCVNASEWAAAVPPDTHPGLFGYIAGFSTHDSKCTDYEISQADFETFRNSDKGFPVPCTPTRGCLTIVAANEEPLSIADASLERRTWDISAMSMDDTSSQPEPMTILTFEVRFNSSIALKFQLPSEDVLRYTLSNVREYSEVVVDEIVSVLSGWNGTDKSFEEIRSIDDSDTLPTPNGFLFDLLSQILPFDVRLQCKRSYGDRRQGSPPAFEDMDTSGDGCISEDEFDEFTFYRGSQTDIDAGTPPPDNTTNNSTDNTTDYTTDKPTENATSDNTTDIHGEAAAGQRFPVFEDLAGLSPDGKCDENEISPADFEKFITASFSDTDTKNVPFNTIPPTDNAVPSFLYKMMFSKSKAGLFRNVTWHSDTFFVVVPVGGPGMVPKFEVEEESCRMLVGDMPAQTFTDTSSDCRVKELLEFGELVAPFLSSLDDTSTGSSTDFFEQTMVLSIVKMMDGYDRCKSMLESMIKASEIMVWVPGQRACKKDWGTDDWKGDPCCNPEKAFEQCCGLKPEMQAIKVIDSILPSDDCDSESPGFQQLNNALLSYSTVDRLRNDPVMGCTAARKQKVSQKSFTRLFKFIDICFDRVYKGKTKAGLAACNQDSECYTSCDVEQRKCVVPYAGPEKAFLQCGLDNMDPTLLSWLRKNNVVSSFDRGNALEKALRSKYAEDRCIGPEQGGGVCLINFEEAACNANVFHKKDFDPSQADALKEALLPLLRAPRWEWVNGYDGYEYIEIPAEPISTSWVQDAPDGLACRVDSLNLWEYSCDSPCTLVDSPWFSPISNPSLICSKIAKALANVSGLDVNSSNGTYISFDPQYDYRYDTDTGTFGRVKISNGSEFWCQNEQTCNHMSPWDADAGNETKCVTDYEDGGTKAMLGSSFCAKCEGPYCSEISSPAVCRYPQIYDQDLCIAEGGFWLATNEWGNYECRVDIRPDHNDSSCFGESFKYCPKEIYSYEWGDTILSYTSYGFCEYMSVCHAPDLTQAACEAKKENTSDSFPMFIGKSIASGFSGGFSGRRHHSSDAEGISPRNTKAVKYLVAQTLLRKMLSTHTDKRGPAHTRANALAARRRGTMHTRQSEEHACTTDREWVDSDGDACGEYEANPEWCYEAELYSVDGHDAKDNCCFCQGLMSAVNNSACTDDADWVDIDGDSCESYYNLDSFNNCPDAHLYADASGQDASTMCCSCKISEEFTEVYTADFDYPVVDADGDGCLSEADFNRLVGYHELDEVLNATQDGCPTFETIQAWDYEYDSRNANGITCLSQQTFDLVSVITYFFASFDGDKSWCLSLAEFSSIFQDDGSDLQEIESEFNNMANSSGYDSCLGNISIRDLYVYVKDAEKQDSQEQYTQEQDKGSFLPFSPKESMCVLWADAWGGWTGGTAWNSKSNCENAGYKWMTPRAFSEGKWNTETSCQGGVCSSSPWDWELAKTPGKCAARGGICSKHCITCDSADVPDICIAQSIMNESQCQEQDLQWSEERQKCYGTRDKNFKCFDRPDKRIISCLDVQVGNKGCAKDGWGDDPLYNGTFFSPNLPSGLSCFTNYYGMCTKANCESGGSCNDWTYANWGAESEDTSSCRIPFTQGSDWGGPVTRSCYDLQSKYPGTTASAWMEDACILNNMKTSDCTAEGGTPVSRADTEAECTRFKGCFDTNYNTITAVDEYECQNEDICDSDRFQWKNVLEWTPGVWSLSKMTSAGIKWSKRRMQAKNAWSQVVSWDTLQNQVYEAAFAMAAEAYVAEFKCQMHPLKAILATVACTCGLDRKGNDTGSVCDYIMEEIKPSVIASKTVFLSAVNEQTLAHPGFGSVTFDRQDLKKSFESGKDSGQIELLYTDAMMLRDSSDRRQITSTSTTCAQFDVIKNAQDQVIGQLAGNGLLVKGLKDSIVTICVPVSEAIPYCSSLLKYSVPDFALGNATSARPGMPLKIPVSIDKSNQFCGEVRLGGSAETETMVYPVLRTDKMLPAGKIGEGVEATITLSGTTTIKNKNHFIGGLNMMAAFRKCVASALAYVSADLAIIDSSSGIVILKVCDAQDSTLDCIDLTANTVPRYGSNSREGPIRVIYRIEPPSASGASVDKICSVLVSMDKYVSKFQALFAAQGYIIRATGVGCPAPLTSLQVAVAPADSPFFLVLVVKMPYTKADFDEGKQGSFKDAIANAAGTSPLNVIILSITEVRRRAGSIEVETKIRAMDAASLRALASTLGTGDAMLGNINAELSKRGLSAFTGVSVKSSNAPDAKPQDHGISGGAIAGIGISGGAIAGIVVGSSLGAIILVCAAKYLVKRHKNKTLVDTDKSPKTAEKLQGQSNDSALAQEAPAASGAAASKMSSQPYPGPNMSAPGPNMSVQPHLGPSFEPRAGTWVSPASMTSPGPSNCAQPHPEPYSERPKNKKTRRIHPIRVLPPLSSPPRQAPRNVDELRARPLRPLPPLLKTAL